MVDMSRPNGGQDGGVSRWLDDFFKFLRNIRQKPVPVQIGIGASSGLLTGFLFAKGSKLVALVLGASIIVIQFLNYRGYIKFASNQLEQDLFNVKQRFQREIGLQKTGFPSSDEAGDFLSRNAYLFGGFTAGNLIGYGLG